MISVSVQPGEPKVRRVSSAQEWAIRDTTWLDVPAHRQTCRRICGNPNLSARHACDLVLAIHWVVHSRDAVDWCC